MKSLSQIAKLVNHQIDTPPPAPVLNNEAIDNINGIFKQLEATCPMFAHSFPTPERVSLAKSIWTKAFIEQGIVTMSQVAMGMRKLRANESDFVPGVGQFIAWCKPSAADYGLTFESVYREIQEYQRKFDDIEFTFSNSIVEHINMRCGYTVSQLTEDKSRKAIKSELDYWINHLANGGEVPAPLLALAAPVVSTLSYAEQHNYQPQSPEAKGLIARLAKIKQNSIEKKGKSDDHELQQHGDIEPAR